MASTAGPQQFSLDYLNEDSSNRLLAAITVILIIVTVLLGLRLYARSLTNAARGWDEFLLPPAWLLVVGACMTGYLSIRDGGAGRHVESVRLKDPGTLTTRSKLIFAMRWCSIISNAFSRISVVALYLRIFTNRLARISSWVVLAYLLGFTVAQIFAGWLQCRPISYVWKLTGTGSCFELFLYYRVCGILNIIGDIAIMVLPVHVIWILQTSTSRKIGIAVVFLSGSLGLIASCIRTALFFGVEDAAANDPTWKDVSLISWTVVESGMYTSAACLIGLRPLFSLLPHWLQKCAIRNKLRGSRNRLQHRPTAGIDHISTSRMLTPCGDMLEPTSFDDHDIEDGRKRSLGSQDTGVNSEIQSNCDENL